jgi:hypothetical protein
MKYLITLLISLSLSSCIVTDKKRAEICRTCPLKETSIVNDSSWQKKYDSLVKIPLKGPVIILKDNPCAELCDSFGKVKDYSKSVVSESGIKGTIKGDKKTNTIIIDCGAKDSIEALLKGVRTENNRLRTEKTVIEVPARCNLEHRTWFDHFCRWGFLVSIIFLIISNRKFIFGLIKKVIV